MIELIVNFSIKRISLCCNLELQTTIFRAPFKSISLDPFEDVSPWKLFHCVHGCIASQNRFFVTLLILNFQVDLTKSFWDTKLRSYALKGNAEFFELKTGFSRNFVFKFGPILMKICPSRRDTTHENMEKVCQFLIKSYFYFLYFLSSKFYNSLRY